MTQSITRGNHVLPEQRVSIKTKQSKNWSKSMADYVIQLAISCNDKSKTTKFLSMANGKVDKDMYEYVLRTFGTKDEEIKESKNHRKLIADLREINLLQPIKDTYLGEFITSYNNYQVYTDDPDTVFLRNRAFGEEIYEIMNQMLINELNAQGVDTGSKSKPTPDIDKMFDKFLQEWDDKRAEDAQNRLNLLNNDIDAKLKYNQAYYYWWACEEVYTYRSIHKNSVLLEVISPLDYYRIDSGNTYVEDDDYGMHISYKSLYQILDLYEEHLTSEDIKFLKGYTSRDITSETRLGLLRSRCIENGMSDEDFIAGSNSITNTLNNPDLIPVVHYVAKTEVKVGYLTFNNAQGELEETLVDESYILQPELGDISIEWDWIQQVWEGECIGYNLGSNLNIESIYTKFRPIAIQREKVTNLNVCKLPYNGLSYIHKDSEKAPIPARVNPYIALYRIYHYQIEKAIQKWKAIITIPQSILTENQDMSLEQRLAYMESENLLVFNDAEVNANTLQSMREIATTATYNYVNTLYQLLRGIKEEAWEQANMTPTRAGNQKAYQGKSVTEASLDQAAISNSWSLEMFNMFRGRDYLANYDYSRVAWSNGKQGSYTDESTNELKRVEVNPMEHVSLNIGINVGNNKLLDEKLRAMKELAFSASQGGEFELATEAILNDNLQVLKRNILNAQESKRAYEQQMNESKNQATIQAQEIARQTQAEKNQHESTMKEMEINGKLQERLIDQETQLLVWDLRLQQDTNGNGYIDDEESLNSQEAIEKAKIEREKLNIKYQELAIKREQMKIAKQNKTQR